MNLKPIKRLIVVGTVASAVVSAAKRKLESEALKSAYLLPEYFTVTAHTGCNDTEANTLESIEAGINSGADIIEFDLLDDSNGTLILSHDFEEGKQCPTFEEALKFVKEHSDTVKMNIDLKRNHISYAADEIIRSLGMTDRCFFTGVDEKDVPLIASTSSIPYYVNVHPSFKDRNSEDYWIETASKVNALGGIGVNCSFKSISKKGVEICKKNSLLVSVFTPDSETELDFTLTLSPDNITTRNPNFILSQRRFK
ncbi:MAG: glycerophosphodiester phosphodiesterase [Ruminococcaceae bacterium]|jgi:glycerophosphoryl diester phosphodiesterase|nr:glycerophosphodiester phosphodiesterase [Oscillospiraceae bacterium]